jgi:alpha-galactosidase
MLKSPLIAGNDLRSMSKATVAILTNRAVIALNQDPLGVQAFRFARHDDVEYWFKPLEKGEWALMVLNRNSDVRKVSFDWSTEDVRDELSRRQTDFQQTTYNLRDLWSGKSAGTTRKTLRGVIPGHDVLVLRMSPVR